MAVTILTDTDHCLGVGVLEQEKRHAALQEGLQSEPW